MIHRRGPWRSFEAVEFATLTWVDWFNHLERPHYHAYTTDMTLGRIGWLMSWLSVIALILTVAMPQRVMAVPMTVMMQTTHCADCPDDAPVPGKVTGDHAKALPCGPSMCVGALAAVLPAPDVVNATVWQPTVYAPGPLAGPSGWPLAPDPIPPRPPVQV